MKYDVFISYSRKDLVVADKICEVLDKAGVSYFIDRQGIGGGMEFPKVIATAIKESELFLFLASENSYSSKFTSSEITFAFNKKQKNQLLPYVIDSSSLPDELEFVFSCINIRNIKEHPIETTLVEDILDLLGRNKVHDPLCPCGSGKLFKDCHGRFISLDNSTESHHAGPVETERSWKVGDYYTGANKSGIVFWVDHTGKHGKIVSLDQKNNLPFCKYSRHDVSLYDACDGEKNFQAIKKNSRWKNKFPASEWCARHGDGWYLPAIEELCDLVRVYDEVNQGLKENKGTKLIIAKSYPCRWYLSSTEYDETRMRAVGMEYCSKDFLDSNLASREIYIRAIAKF